MRTSWFDIIVPSLVSIAGALVMTTSCSPAYAQQRVATTYQYSAKTLCTLAPDIGFGDAFAPGGYRTVINIHNPSDRKIEIARSSRSPSSPERLRALLLSPRINR